MYQTGICYWTMKLLYKILILFYGTVIISVIVWLFIPIHKNSKPKNYSYAFFDSTLLIKTPFQIKDNSKKYISNHWARSITYIGKNIELDIECIKYQFPFPVNNTNEQLLNSWLITLDNKSKSNSTLQVESRAVLKKQKFEYYEGIINYTANTPPTNLKKKHFSTVITFKGNYLYLIDIHYNQPDKEALNIRNEIYNSIEIR